MQTDCVTHCLQLTIVFKFSPGSHLMTNDNAHAWILYTITIQLAGNPTSKHLTSSPNHISWLKGNIIIITWPEDKTNDCSWKEETRDIPNIEFKPAIKKPINYLSFQAPLLPQTRISIWPLMASISKFMVAKTTITQTAQLFLTYPKSSNFLLPHLLSLTQKLNQNFLTMTLQLLDSTTVPLVAALLLLSLINNNGI